MGTDADGYKAVTCVFNLAECVCDADYVQESVVEDIVTKTHIIQEIDHFAPLNVIIGSSTSFIPLSLVRSRAARHPERVAITHPSIPHWDAFCEVLGSSEEIMAWLATLYGRTSGSASGINGLGMDVVQMKREQHGHVLNTLLSFNMAACILLVKAGVCDAAACDTAFLHMCRCGQGAGGLGGIFRLVGGGSAEAAKDLMVDVAMGLPLGKATTWASFLLPSWLVRPLLCPLRICMWPWALFKGIVRRLVSWMVREFTETWEESMAVFGGRVLNRICALEQLQ